MTLSEYSTHQKRLVFDDLEANKEPHAGSFDQAKLNELSSRGTPQIGATIYHPNTITFEFIYHEHGVSLGVLSVEFDAPERIVFMPVPGWVVESVWQGHVDGSHHFESDAKALVREFESQLSVENNNPLFEAKKSIGRS